MEALFVEAALCTQGEERARVLVEAIRGMVGEDETNDWLTLAVSLAQQAVYEMETRAVVVDGLIEAGGGSVTPFHCQPLATLEVLGANFSALAAPEDGWPRFEEAILRGDAIMVDLLIQGGVDPSAAHNWAIRFASAYGHLSVVERLLQDARVDPSAANNRAIQTASNYGHLSVVERLLQDARVDPSEDDNWTIRFASVSGYISIVDRLLQDARVDPSADDNWAIHNAVVFGHYSVTKRLLQDERVRSTLSAEQLAAYSSV